jgi:hypothetical protein
VVAHSDLIQATPSVLAQAAAPQAVSRLAASASASTLSSALPAPPSGQDVQGAVLQNAAHLKVDAGAQGALELHLRVRDGALHLRVDGPSAHLVESRSSELSSSLAGQGLKLAPIETGSSQEQPGMRSGSDGGRQGEERREAWNDAEEARDRSSPAPSTSNEPAAAAKSGIHVKA